MHWITPHLERFRPGTACIEGDRPRSYSDLLAALRAAGEVLDAAHLPPRTVVALRTRTTFEGLAALLALAGRPLVALPLPAELPAVEAAAQLTVSGAGHILHCGPDGFALEPVENPPAAGHPLLARLAPSGHPGLILFSSGTSGQPKAMLHDLEALLGRFAGTPRRDERSLLLLLIDHIGGLDAALRTLFAGSTLVVPSTRTPEDAGAAIERHQVTILPASPTFLNLILLAGVPEKADCRSLRLIAYGAEPMPEKLLAKLGAAFPGVRLEQKFGTSETGAVRTRSAGDDSLFFRIVDTDTQWRVVDGELWLRTPSRILGYLNAADHSLEADGWYRTGDLVEEGPDGLIRILGRRSATINVGGRKVHPAEIEAVLASLPGAATVRVFGRPDPITGSSVAAEITPEPGMTRDLREWKREVRAHCRGRLAPWKVPSHLVPHTGLEVTRRMKRKAGE